MHTKAALLTRDEVAALLRISTQTLMIWVAAGKFPRPMRLGRRALWDHTTVEGVLREYARQPVTPEGGGDE